MENKTNETTTEVVAQQKKAVAVKETTIWSKLHGSWKSRIGSMLPEKSMIDQFIFSFEGQYGKNKEAFEELKPISLLNCLLVCAKFGILPDGRNAHLIPYGKECTLQFDYKGFVHILIRDGAAKKIYADVICENDEYDIRDGIIHSHIIHLPRGKVIGAYCKITLPNGDVQFEVMDIDEINSVKACSKGSGNPNSPWNKFFKEMAKKSVFRRCTKWIKLTPDVRDALNVDDDGYDFGNQNPNQIPVVKSQSPLFPQEHREEVKQIPQNAEKKEPEKVVETVDGGAFPF